MEAAASEVTREKRCCSPYLRKGGMRERREEDEGEGGRQRREREGWKDGEPRETRCSEHQEKVEGPKEEYNVLLRVYYSNERFQLFLQSINEI